MPRRLARPRGRFKRVAAIDGAGGRRELKFAVTDRPGSRHQPGTKARLGSPPCERARAPVNRSRSPAFARYFRSMEPGSTAGSSTKSGNMQFFEWVRARFCDLDVGVAGPVAPEHRPDRAGRSFESHCGKAMNGRSRRSNAARAGRAVVHRRCSRSPLVVATDPLAAGPGGRGAGRLVSAERSPGEAGQKCG